MNKRLFWLMVIIVLLALSFNVIPQITHSRSKKNSIKEEIITVNKKIEEKVHFIGMIFLLVLMLIIVFFDVTKYF